jgi:hypothetical protein
VLLLVGLRVSEILGFVAFAVLPVGDFIRGFGWKLQITSNCEFGAILRGLPLRGPRWLQLEQDPLGAADKRLSGSG